MSMAMNAQKVLIPYTCVVVDAALPFYHMTACAELHMAQAGFPLGWHARMESAHL